MQLWKYEEEKETHLLVKFYRENHGEGTFLGDVSDDKIKEMILEIKPDINPDKSLGTLSYFGFLPILVLKAK